MEVSLRFQGGELGRRTYVAILFGGVAIFSTAEWKFEGVGPHVLLGSRNGAIRVGLQNLLLEARDAAKNPGSCLWSGPSESEVVRCLYLLYSLHHSTLAVVPDPIFCRHQIESLPVKQLPFSINALQSDCARESPNNMVGDEMATANRILQRS